MKDRIKCVPIAEYMGVALVEVHGDKPKVYEGQTYSTDGFTTLIKKAEGDAVQFLSIPEDPERGISSEGLAKAFIEEMPLLERGEYLNFREVLEMLGLEVQVPSGSWIWDEKAQQFERIDGFVMNFAKQRLPKS